MYVSAAIKQPNKINRETIHASYGTVRLIHM